MAVDAYFQDSLAKNPAVQGVNTQQISILFDRYQGMLLYLTKRQGRERFDLGRRN